MSATAEPGVVRARATERRLLLFALVIVMSAYTILGLSQSSRVPAGTLLYGAALAALAAVAHLAVRRYAPHADPVLLPVVFLLNGLGLVLIRRIDFDADTRLAVAQTTWTFVAIAAFALTLFLLRDHRRLATFRYTAGLLAIVLLVLPLLPKIGATINGARLWLRLGPLSFQPGEIAKVAIVVFLAGYLAEKRQMLSVATTRFGPFLLPSARHLAPVIAAAAIGIGILVMQRDLGSSLLFFGVFMVSLYVATGRFAYPLVGLTAFSLGTFLAYNSFSHVRTRFDIWLDPWADPLGSGYQLVQSLFAFGTGGLTGTGLGLGLPGEIPFVATDAIFAVAGEELGLMGTTALLVCFLLVVARGFKAALTANDDVGVLLATGLTTILALQVFVIIGGVTRLVPLTGITLPFMSYGGSSLVSNYVIVALLLRISDDGRGSARAQTARIERARPQPNPAPA